MTIDDIKKAIREIEIYHDYNYSKNDYDILLNLTELANLIKTLQGKAIDDFVEKLVAKKKKNCLNQTAEECLKVHMSVHSIMEILAMDDAINEAFEKNLERLNGYNKEDIELNRNAMYNKGINDLVEKIELKYLGVHPDELYYRYYPIEICKQVNELAEQLKVGRK